jgi:hypothetical protein
LGLVLQFRRKSGAKGPYNSFLVELHIRRPPGPTSTLAGVVGNSR